MTKRHTARLGDRVEGALLAGVCADLARRLGWNVWAVRAVAVIGLFIDAVVTALAYGVLALVLAGVRRHSGDAGGAATDELQAPELDQRKQRIADLERRFRDLENGPS